MSFPYQIQKLTKDDYYNGFLQLLEQLTIVNSRNISYDDFCNQYDKLTSNTNIFIIKNEQNKIIATATLLVEIKFIHELSSVGHIEDVVVDTNYRNKKIGKLLVNYLVEYAKNNKCYKVILDCSEKNKLFYEACNFEFKGIQMAKYFD